MKYIKDIWNWYTATKFHRVIIALWAVKFVLIPKWMVPVIGIALLIPGPQDEILCFILVGVWVLCHKDLRHLAAKIIREA